VSEASTHEMLASISRSAASICPGIRSRSPQSTSPVASTGLTPCMVAASEARREFSRTCAGPERAPILVGWYPMSNGMPTTATWAAERSVEKGAPKSVPTDLPAAGPMNVMRTP